MTSIPKQCKNYSFNTDNNIFPWIDSDNKERFAENCKNFPKEMQQWKNQNFTYILNRYGFRTSKSFDLDTPKTKKRALALGCSHTFGLGLPLQDIWPTKVSNLLDWEIINLGMPGGSLDSVFRILYIWFTYLDPDFVIIQKPTKERREYFLENNEVITAGAWRETFVKFSYLNWGNSFDEFYEEKNIAAIKQICNTVPVLYFDIEKFRKDDLARDMIHFGKETHNSFSQHITQRLNEYKRNLH